MMNFFGKKEEPEAIITQNREMFAIKERGELVAPTLQPILITGETGVGKELIARYIHRLSGVKGKLVVVNAAGLDDNLFSDTLFGHSRGAFTGADIVRKGMIEQASSGTLFLDEIGDLSIASQVKLLRLLEQGEYHPLGMDEPKISTARIIAATNQDLWKLYREGKFRKDLNFRLRIHHIHIPPLRDRRDDISRLTDFFMAEAARVLSKKKPTPPAELFILFDTYSFPGNIRELRGMIFDAISQMSSGHLSLDTFKNHIDKERERGIFTRDPGMGDDDSSPFTYLRELPTLKRAAQLLVAEALRRSKNNQSVAAKILGISQPALSNRLKHKRAESD